MTPARSIIFLTTLNLTANPRLLKELDLAYRAGLDVAVIYFSLGNWGDQNDLRIIQSYPTARFICISATRKPFLPWAVSTFAEKCARVLCRFIDIPLVNGIAAGKRSLLLLLAVIRVKKHFDWVVAHNPAAFHPAMVYSARKKARLGIDVEDYHPAETSVEYLSNAIRSLMRECIGSAEYASYSSPVIRETSEAETSIPKKSIDILNYFPKSQFLLPETEYQGRLRLVWFSQNITKGRGLEIVLPVIASQSDSLELHIYGLLDPKFESSHLMNSANIFFHGTIPQSDLHGSLAKYDVGLATEVLTDKNKDLVVTNKFIAYLQSGLFLAVTHTYAQKKLLQHFSEHGLVFEPTPEDFSSALTYILENIQHIRAHRLERYKKMSLLSWETESEKILDIWLGNPE